MAKTPSLAGPAHAASAGGPEDRKEAPLPGGEAELAAPLLDEPLPLAPFWPAPAEPDLPGPPSEPLPAEAPPFALPLPPDGAPLAGPPPLSPPFPDLPSPPPFELDPA